VLLVGGRELFRQAVHSSLENVSDIVVIGEARDARQAERDAIRLEPDVVLVDATGRDNGAPRATASLKERFRRCAVVVMGEEDAETLIDVMEAGASGYVTQESPLTDLIQTTRSVYEGQTLIPQSMIGSLISGLITRRREDHEAFERLARLTQREREVLHLLGGGANNQRIARVLSISPETARTHVQNLLGKLQVHSRLEAAAFVLQARSLGPPRSQG
jgi:DNA-binding NarL/FixJ family response regulator